jgi:hypothetical protein
MMPEPEPVPRSQRNTIRGTGNIITGGTLTNSQVVATSVSGPPNPLIQQLQDELTRVRECLAAFEAPTADHEDAIEAVDTLQDEVSEDLNPGQSGLRRLRVRVRELIGVLTPVAEIVGGVAAFEEICRHL